MSKYKIGSKFETERDLLQWQPKAINVCFTVCHCPRRAVMASYQLDGMDRPRGENRESCGYFCGTCGFANAGSREKQP